MNLTPGNHWLTATVGTIGRPFRVHAPMQRKRNLAVLANDSVTLLNPEGNTGRGNGIDDAAET